MEFFAGNYHDYEQDYHKRMSEAGIDPEPKRVHYKKLTR